MIVLKLSTEGLKLARNTKLYHTHNFCEVKHLDTRQPFTTKCIKRNVLFWRIYLRLRLDLCSSHRADNKQQQTTEPLSISKQMLSHYLSLANIVISTCLLSRLICNNTIRKFVNSKTRNLNHINYMFSIFRKWHLLCNKTCSLQHIEIILMCFSFQ